MKRLTFFLLVFAPLCLFAQSNYLDGYIIKSNGDTLKGYINYQEWSYSPQGVEFKASLSDVKPQEFNPGNIKGFGVRNAETYVSFTGLISTNKNVFPNIPSSLDTTRQPGAIFMKLLATGDHLTLFANADVNKNRFFIEEKNSAPSELNFYEYYGDSGTEVIDNLYRGQLILYAYKYNNGDKKLLDAIADVKFGERDLEDIIDKINNISLKTQPGGSANIIKKSKLRFFAGIGANSLSSTYNYSLLRTFNLETDEIFGAASSNYVKPRFSIGLDVFNNPDIQQFIFRTEITYASFGGSFELPPNNTSTTTITGVDLAYTGYYLSLAPQVLFNFYNKEKFKIYLGLGIAYNVASYSNNQNGNDQSYIDGASTNIYFPMQAGIIVGQRFELSFTYASFTTSASFPSVTVSNKSTTSFGLRVHLF